MKKHSNALLAAAILAASPAIAQMPDPVDRFAIVDTLTSIAAGADRHDWPRVRTAFASEVTIDYSSLWGGVPTTMKADDLVAQWAAFLPGFDQTLHLVTNHTITAFDGKSASAEADFQALHRIGEDTWVLSGHYAYRLVKVDGRWAVSSLTMTWTHETGDRALAARAGASAQTGQ